MITPQTRSKIADWYQGSIANRAGDVLAPTADEPGMMTTVEEKPAAGMLTPPPEPQGMMTATEKAAAAPPVQSQQPIQPTDPFSGKANLNAQGKAMSFAESLAHEGEQQRYDETQSAMWNQLHGRWRTGTDPTTGRITPQGQAGSQFAQSLVSGGMMSPPTTTPTTTPPATTTTPTTTAPTTTPTTSTTPTTGGPSNYSPTLLTAVRNFQANTGLLKDQSPEAIIDALGRVTAAEFNSMSPDQQAQARDLYRLAGISVPTGATPAPGGPAPDNRAVTIDRNDLSRRTLTPEETAQGQILGMMDGPVAEAARQNAYRQSNARGLLNSSIAVQAGEQAALESVTQLAQADAAAQRGAGDYNVALDNQATMYNTDKQNEYLLQQMGIESQERQQGRSLLAQLDIAKLNDATARWNAERQDATSRYNTDQQYRTDMERTRMQMANNIAMSADMPPARRAEMLRAMGFPDLANAIYVVTDATEEIGGGGRPNDTGQSS